MMAALFPCASITGAPKPRTMQIIADLETTPRRVYTGCIGYYAPQRQAQFNVAIRTVLVDRSNNQAEYGVGGGIVWDSTSIDEYNECMVKARVLTELQPSFDLLESLLWSSQNGFFLLEQHLQRMSDSAQYFNFPCDVQQARRQLEALAVGLPPGAHKVRLLLDKNGNFVCSAAPIDLAQNSRPVHLGLAAQPVNSNDVYLYHKTTWRKVYEAALATCPDCDDVSLWNERDELTETCVGNLVAQIGGELFTPPVECGLLEGVYRAHLLAQGIVHERVIRKIELPSCERVFVVNSVRGMREANF
jgi:para-aminobenzoate synthetase/4-amino-4-deoxychorismate lyase